MSIQQGTTTGEPSSGGVYIHLPFCAVHCAYCPFAVSTDLRYEDDYIDALVREISLASDVPWTVGTVFYGGGTPSRTRPDLLARVDAAVRKHFTVHPGAEVSLEANPEDVSDEALQFWRSIGVNRVSIGVQAFEDIELTTIGRRHGSGKAHEAVAAAVDAGLRVSLDLIGGLPRQTGASLERSLLESVKLGVGHLSLYMLDLEEGTALYSRVRAGVESVPADEDVAESYSRAVELLEACGLAQYEISNFAREGEECRHNVNYWRRLPYAGLGLGAHSFNGQTRFANSRNMDDYISSLREGRRPTNFEETLGPDEIARERIFLALRQKRGLEYSELIELRGREGVAWVEKGVEEKWLTRIGERVAFTVSGFLLSNHYISELF